MDDLSVFGRGLLVRTQQCVKEEITEYLCYGIQRKKSPIHRGDDVPAPCLVQEPPARPTLPYLP